MQSTPLARLVYPRTLAALHLSKFSVRALHLATHTAQSRCASCLVTRHDVSMCYSPQCTHVAVVLPILNDCVHADGMYGQGGGGMGGMYGGGAGGGMGGMYGGGGGGFGGGRRRAEDMVEGKLFLGGIDNNTTKEDIEAYANGWCAGILVAPHSSMFATVSCPCQVRLSRLPLCRVHRLGWVALTRQQTLQGPGSRCVCSSEGLCLRDIHECSGRVQFSRGRLRAFAV